MFKNVYRSILTILLLSCLAASPLMHADAYIFDIGGVLVDTHKMRSFSALGIRNVMQYFLYVRRGPKAIKDKFYEVLNTIKKVQKINQRPGRTIVRDDEGKPLPYIMVLWLKGKMSGTMIRSLVLDLIDANPQWFSHPVEQTIIRNLATMVFTPEQFIATRKIHQEAVDFVKACKQEGHQVYILSNWDPESYKLLKATYPELFSLFDGEVISGHVGKTKPNKKIYKGLLKRFKLNPRDCWFIDDQKENVQAARELKICGIWCKKQSSLFGAKPHFGYVNEQIAQWQQIKTRIKTAHRFA